MAETGQIREPLRRDRRSSQIEPLKLSQARQVRHVVVGQTRQHLDRRIDRIAIVSHVNFEDRDEIIVADNAPQPVGADGSIAGSHWPGPDRWCS